MMRRVGLDWIGARPSGRSLIWVTGGPAGPDMGREDLAVRHSHITMQHPGLEVGSLLLLLDGLIEREGRWLMAIATLQHLLLSLVLPRHHLLPSSGTTRLSSGDATSVVARGEVMMVLHAPWSAWAT